MILDIEALRAWLDGQRPRRPNIDKIAAETGYPLESLLKFADGRVKEPRWRNLGRLIDYKNESEKAA